jgi:glutaredoxin
MLRSFNPKIEPGPNNPKLEARMKAIGRSDFKTWPRIFRGNTFVGGFSDLEKLFTDSGMEIRV